METPSSEAAGRSSAGAPLPYGPPAGQLPSAYGLEPNVLSFSSARRAIQLVPVAMALVLVPMARGDTLPQTTPTVLHLDEAVERSLQLQPNIISAQANVLSGQGVAEQTRAGLLPQLSASAVGERTYGVNGTRTTTGTGGAVTTAATKGASNLFTFGLSGTQLLWDFQTVDRFRASNASVTSLQATQQATVIKTVLSVRTAFFLAQADKGLVKVQEETLANQIKHQAQTEGFVKVGTQPAIALAQARTDVANARVALIQAQNNYRIAKAQLNQAMGVVQGVDYDIGGEELEPLPGEGQSVDALTDIALHERPEIASQLSNRDAQDLNLRAARGMYAPAFSLFAGAGETGETLHALGTYWDFGLQVTWGFFDGLRTPGVVKQAQGNLDNANALLTAQELQVRFDVEQAAATLEGSKTALVASEDALVNAREQLRLAEQRYVTGVGSIIELSDAQVASTNAGAQLVQARFTLATARAQLLAALGRR
jgi:outer membrane protein